MLVERAGDVVTREELQQMLWPAETFVDFEHGLNTSVKELRRVLSDSAAEPRYIETLPKLGYRIVAAVEAGALKLLYLALRNIIQKWDTVQGWKHPRQGAAQVPAIGLRRYRDAVGGIPPRERVRDHLGEWEREPAVRFDQVMRFSGALRSGGRAQPTESHTDRPQAGAHAARPRSDYRVITPNRPRRKCATSARRG